MIIHWERRSVELDVHVAEHKVNCEIPKCWVHHHENRNEDDVLASSEKQS
jgi:hypothetical protein